MVVKVETLKIEQVHDNDKYIVVRNIREELNGEELLKIYEEIEKADKDAIKQMEEVPKQLAERTKYFEEQHKILKERMDEFEKFTKKIKAKVTIEEPKVEEKTTGETQTSAA